MSPTETNPIILNSWIVGLEAEKDDLIGRLHRQMKVTNDLRERIGELERKLKITERCLKYEETAKWH